MGLMLQLKPKEGTDKALTYFSIVGTVWKKMCEEGLITKVICHNLIIPAGTRVLKVEKFKTMTTVQDKYTSSSNCTTQFTQIIVGVIKVCGDTYMIRLTGKTAL